MFGCCCELLYFIANHGDDFQLKMYQCLLERANYSNKTTDNTSRNMRLEFICDVLKRCPEIYSLVHDTNNNKNTTTNNNTLMQMDHHQQ